MINYFIIHGSLGNPSENWFPWLTQNLIEKGKNVIVPHFPGPKEQNYDNWSKLMMYYKNLGLINEETVFICHSVAVIFVCKFLIKNKIEIKSLISVAGFNALLDSELDEINKTFLVEEKEFTKIDKYVRNVYCFYSDNDPFVSRDALEEFIYKIKGAKCLIKSAGHFNSISGYKEFPQILEAIEKIEKTKFEKELL